MEYDLSKRKAQILRAVVEAYVKGGEPVGSKYIAQNMMPNCSPATIRNEMAELEMLGYLEQPHTSAGRIPSELGYRFYVDCLASEYKKTKTETELMAERLKGKQHELDKILAEASRLAGSMTNYTAIAVKPRADMSKIIRFEVMYYDSRNLVIVMLSGSGVAKTRNLRLSFDVLPTDAAHLANTLNMYIAGRTLEEITLPLMMQAESEMGSEARLLSAAMKEIYSGMEEQSGGEIKVDGVDRLLSYPEFSDVGKLRGLLGAIENKDGILNTISNIDGDELSVVIGKENMSDSMSDSTLVVKKIKKDGKVVGAIGIIGPCRMDYANVMATVDALAESVGRVINSELKMLEGPKKGIDDGRGN